MRIAIVGTGYVGLVSGACFAELGHDVWCVDVDAAKVEALRAGHIPIFEPGIEELVKINVEDNRLAFTTDLEEAVKRSVMIFIAVGTPSLPDGTADLSQVFEAARGIARHMDGYRVIVDKSTVPVGTSRKVAAAIREELERRGEDFEFDVVSNPEFLKEGAAIEDFMNPDRVVIGCDNVQVQVLMEELYSHFARNARPILCMSPESAEMTKYAANAMLATKISFMNEIANLCEEVGANVDDVRNGIGSDQRIGYRFIFPGIGYGGSCFPKDIKALIHTAREAGREAALLRAVDEINEAQKRSLLQKIRAYYGDNIEGRRFAVWGLAFKPETDDVRDAPSLVIVRALLEGGAHVRAYDPKAAATATRALGTHERLEFLDRYYDCAEGCDALVLCTEWSFFRNADLERVKQLLRHPVVFDGRNVYRPEKMRKLGFDYFSIGRAPVLARDGR
ncbi:MAG TPA: UDP-glucose/GDP-mannose dehydrogenase family protein [Candidatus Hydrogenedentes bacterium]|nr:UDP-glucose/GDP-mannose dehydrogenase family protein [Candidatus Hydrogenedentota bacterium]HNT87098.1 UDP-glucose/GDP-mannose dehydrogenase family protein [Candidatus Hydrogenedentota bacterium]